jgi:hypothetical protein
MTILDENNLDACINAMRLTLEKRKSELKDYICDRPRIAIEWVQAMMELTLDFSDPAKVNLIHKPNLKELGLSHLEKAIDVAFRDYWACEYELNILREARG